MIWYKSIDLDSLQRSAINTMVEHLGIKYIEATDNSISASMAVNSSTVQPMRLLHGGASVALAETLGSVASFLTCDPEKIEGCVGIEINASHTKSATEGSMVIGTVKPIKIGRTIQIWEIRIFNEQNELVCISKLTTMVLYKRNRSNMS